jgi:hypothetical protein
MVENPRYAPGRADSLQPRGGQSAGGGSRPDNDPLAELARLIGRDDPFAELRRDIGQSSSRPEPATSPEPAAPNWLARQRATPGRDPADGARTPADPRSQASDTQWRASRYRDQIEREEAPAEHFSQPEYRPDDAGEGASHHDRGYDAGDAYGQPAYEGAPPPVARDYETDVDYADEQAAPEGDEIYQAPRPPRHGRLLTMAAVLAIIVLLIGGAFGYRALTTPRDPSQTPVIAADRSPSKVVPAAQNADSQANKLIYDRVADKVPESGDLVSREERPVDVRSAAPRVVFPGGTAVAGSNATSPQQMTGAGSNIPPTPGMASEPKKVKTLTIRPDQTASAESAEASSPWPPAPTARSAAAPTAPAQPGTRSLQRPASPETTEATNPPAQQRTANNAPVPVRAPEAGGFVVQLFSGRSEAEAQDQFRALQGKYHGVLGGRQPIIRRADLGEKGVFYRAQVGPFGTIDLANQLCGNLKNAGGQCIVQRN